MIFVDFKKGEQLCAFTAWEYTVCSVMALEKGKYPEGAHSYQPGPLRTDI